MPISILIADPHVMLAEALAKQLELHDMKIVMVASRADQAASACGSIQPDVLLTEIRFGLETLTGFDIADDLLQRYPRTRIVFFSTLEDTEVIAEAYRLGALGYVPKSASLRDLIWAIQMAAKGDRLILPDLRERLAMALTEPDKFSPMPRLNAREFEIFLALARFGSITDAADELGLSRKTIHLHVKSIKEKLGIERPVEMTLLAVRHRLIDPWTAI